MRIENSTAVFAAEKPVGHEFSVTEDLTGVLCLLDGLAPALRTDLLVVELILGLGDGAEDILVSLEKPESDGGIERLECHVITLPPLDLNHNVRSLRYRRHRGNTKN
jgi:hypothetical protein